MSAVGEALRGAVAFLTRVPVTSPATGREQLGASLPWFPVVGAALGVALAVLYAAALVLLPPLVAAALAVGAGIAATGALHEDGLADTADALGAGVGKREALRILKDPTLGTYGIVALVLGVVLRVGALASLGGWSAFAALPAAHALSRSAAAWAAGTIPSATRRGLGAAYATAAGRRQVDGAVAAGVVLAAGALGPWAVPAVVLAALASWGVGALARRRLGGVTGDVLGAVEQAAEVSVLLVAAAVEATWPPLAWWR